MDVSMSRCGLPTGLVWLWILFPAETGYFGQFCTVNWFLKEFQFQPVEKNQSKPVW